MKVFDRLKRHLQLWDGIWSILVGALIFFVVGSLIQVVFTNPADPQGAPGFYDPSFIQAAAYASFIQVCVNTAVLLGMYFNFRGVWRYLYGNKDREGHSVENQSKSDFKTLKAWQKIVLSLSLYLLLSLEWLVLFAHLL
jgi:hypothetical protein